MLLYLDVDLELYSKFYHLPKELRELISQDLGSALEERVKVMEICASSAQETPNTS